MIQIEKAKLDKAWSEGAEKYIYLITDEYAKALSPQITEENINNLNIDQHTLNAYRILLDEVMVGGFIQLIQNGYAPYVLDGPFPLIIKKDWGFRDFGKYLYEVKKEYHKHEKELTASLNDEEFMALYEQFDAINELGDAFLDDYQETMTPAIAEYVRKNENRFINVI